QRAKSWLYIKDSSPRRQYVSPPWDRTNPYFHENQDFTVPFETSLEKVNKKLPKMPEQFPEKVLFTIQRYGFEEPPTADDPPENYDNFSFEELVDVAKELRQKVDMYATELEQELKAKLKQSRMLSVLEMHLDILPRSSRGHVQSTSLEHAVTWLGRYGHKNGQGLLLDVNDYQRSVMTKRIREIMHQAQLCDTRPACIHVLQARPQTLHPGDRLTFHHIALGLPLESFLSTIDWSQITEDRQVWRLLDGALEHYARNDDRLSPEELRTKSFLSLYFTAQTTPEFIHTKTNYIANLQREGHDKKNLKACENVPQSNIRRLRNRWRKMRGDEDLETVSPTKSTVSGLAVAPRVGPGIPRPKRQSFVRLWETAGAAATGPMMTGAIRGSGAMSGAAASVERDRRERSRSRSRTREGHATRDAGRDRRERSHSGSRTANAHRLERIREGEVVPPVPPTPQGPQLQRRERVRTRRPERPETGEPSRSGRERRETGETSRSGHSGRERRETGEPSRSGRERREIGEPSRSGRERHETGEPSRSGRESRSGSGAGPSVFKRVPSTRNPVSPVSDSAHRQPVSPVDAAPRPSPALSRDRERKESPLVPEQHRKASGAGPSGLVQQSSPASRSSGTPGVAHHLHPSARETPGSSGRRQKTPITPGTTPLTAPPRHDQGSSSNVHAPSGLSKVTSVTAWPDINSPAQERKERLDGKGKGKAREEPVPSPSTNPYTSKEPAGLPDDWVRDPTKSQNAPSKTSKSSKSSRETRWPGLPSVAHKVPAPVPPPASSIYSAQEGEIHGSALPQPLHLRRDREARERLVDEYEPEPQTPAERSKPAPSPSKKSSPGVSIPAGVDLTNVAGGLGHGYNFVRNRDSTSTIDKERRPAVPEGVDLSTAAGTASRYVPPRKAWDPELNPKSPMEEIRREHRNRPGPYLPEEGGPYRPEDEYYEEGEHDVAHPPSPQRTYYTDSVTTSTESKSKSSRSDLRRVPGKESLHPSRSKESLIPRNVYIAQPGEVDDPDQWSSQIGLPASPGGTTISRSQASQAFESPARGRPAQPRSRDKIDYLTPVVEQSQEGASTRSGSRSPMRSTRFQEHIDSIYGAEYNPVTNPDPVASREASREPSHDRSSRRQREEEPEQRSSGDKGKGKEKERVPTSRLPVSTRQSPHRRAETFQESHETEEDRLLRERRERRRAERRAEEQPTASTYSVDSFRRRQREEMERLAGNMNDIRRNFERERPYRKSRGQDQALEPQVQKFRALVRDIGSQKPQVQKSRALVRDIGSQKPQGQAQDIGSQRPRGQAQGIGSQRPQGPAQDIGSQRPQGLAQDIGSSRRKRDRPRGLHMDIGESPVSVLRRRRIAVSLIGL
ncbi:hypothetical protein V8F20_006269, partial [Naviculisporaceae sp. PSN 640]